MMKMTQIESSLGMEQDYFDRYENTFQHETKEIALMKNDIITICEQLEKITLYEIFMISKMLDQISFYIPSRQFNISKYSNEFIRVN